MVELGKSAPVESPATASVIISKCPVTKSLAVEFATLVFLY